MPTDTDEERAAAAQIATFQQSGNGYFVEMATRPQTIGYALLDFPHRPGRLDGRPRHGRLLQDRARLRRRAAVGQPHARPHPRQHHAVLADRHRRPPAARSYWEAYGPDASGREPGSPCRRRRSRSASRRSPARSGGLRAAGSRRATRTSSTSTRSTGRPLRRLGGAGAVLRELRAAFESVPECPKVLYHGGPHELHRACCPTLG
jgi:hypothetical protein